MKLLFRFSSLNCEVNVFLLLIMKLLFCFSSLVFKSINFPEPAVHTRAGIDR